MNADLPAAARRLLPLLDLTSLNDARDDDVASLCDRAATPVGPVAAVCLWPDFVAEARRRLPAGGLRIATVINFPDGADDAAAAAAEARAALADGADELDLVFPFAAWQAGDAAAARDLVAAVRTAAGDATLKVILETGVLGGSGIIAAAAETAVAAGADFLKTSTGKRSPGATPEAVRLLLEVSRADGGRVGVKAAGGIRTTAQAAGYLALADEIMGPDWATPARFRIGASSLLDDLLAVLGAGPAASDRSGY